MDLLEKCYNQTKGFDYFETFSPIIKHVTVRTVLTLVVSKGWDIKQLDVNKTFLNRYIAKDVYMDQPQDFWVKSSILFVCKLKKILYGLKKALQTWYDKLRGHLFLLDFQQSKGDAFMFIH